MDDQSAAGFESASRFFVQAVRLIEDDQWTAPGMGSWNIRELVGHANRAHSTVEEYLLRPVPPEPPQSSYFSEESIERRGREAIVALGNDPKNAVDEASRQTIGLIAKTPSGATIGSPARTMTLAQYLPSRTAELTIHGLDIVHALGAELTAPPEALVESLAFVTKATVSKGNGELVLHALSGRGTLPSGFSVY